MGLTVSVITDEISPDLAVGIAFATGHGLGQVDIRSIAGRNFMSLGSGEQKAAAKQLRDAGLKVGCLATPLLKWPAPGRSAGSAGDQFGFDAGGKSDAEMYEVAFEAAAVLGTKNLRIFSYLIYPEFRLGDLDQPYAALLRLAEQHDCMLHVENEPVCNILSVGDLDKLMQKWRHPRLKALLDIGNAYFAGTPTTADEVARVMPFVDQAHFKDYKAQKRGYVPMGEGDVPFSSLMAPVLVEGRHRDLVLTIETHVPDEQPAATERSLAGLRRLVDAV